MRETVLEAVLRSADAPSEVQRNRFAAFLKKQYGQGFPSVGNRTRWKRAFGWKWAPTCMTGVWRAVCGSSGSGWSWLNPAGVSVIPLMREAVRNWQPDAAPEEVGSVLTVGDEIAVSGLEHAAYGEILQFPPA